MVEELIGLELLLAAPIRERISMLKQIDYRVVERIKVEVKRFVHARELKPVTVRESQLRRAGCVLVTTLRNEAFRLPHFLEYYRKLGVEHFLVIDNQSDDDVQALVAGMPDVSIWLAEGSYKDARYGVVWMNHLLGRYCTGKWIVNVDPDEYLVFRDQDEIGLAGLAARLDREGVRALATMMVDMYSDKPVAQNHYRAGQDPLEVCPYFDAYGYRESVENPLSVKHVRGGPRARIFFGQVESSPMLQKTPFVKWRRHYAFTRGSACEIWPPNLADTSYASRRGMPGALLHFKFLAQFVDKVAEEQARKQHTDEYVTYQARLDSQEAERFMYAGSRRFENWTSLARVGILS